MSAVHTAESSIAIKWYYRPFWVLVLCFVVLGPLGLPYLWRSPRFSRGAKILLSGCVIVYTGLIVVESVRLVQEVRDEMKALQIDLD